MRLGRRAHQSHLPACAIRAIARSARAEESDLRCCRLHSHGRLYMLKDGTFYEDLGAVHFDRRRPETQARRLVKRLAELGFSVELKPAAAVS
jgi:hypothetical protein